MGVHWSMDKEMVDSQNKNAHEASFRYLLSAWRHGSLGKVTI